MKRAAWSSPIISSFALLTALTVAACHPTEPKQASSIDPDDEGGSAGASSSSSSGSSRGGDDIMVPPPAGGPTGSPGKSGPNEPALVNSLASVLEGVRWGVSHGEVQKRHTENGGVIWKDYDAKLAHARVGPEMTAIEAEREQAKAAFGRSFVEFKDTPTGYDATGIKGEYTYRNRESLMWINRAGKKRYFFFINDRLWKVYDEVPLTEGGPMGKSYLDAVNKMNAQLGVQGRILGADASKGVMSTTVDWRDGTTRLRMVDRSGDNVVGVVLEDLGTLGNIASLRTNKEVDPTAIDPTIEAVTKGGLSDPNAPKPEAAPPPGKKPKKK